MGRVPTHWEILSLGQIGTLTKGTGGNKEDELSTGMPCVRYGDLHTTHKYFIENARSFISPEVVDQYRKIKFGDVLFAASGETADEIGKSAVNLLRKPAYCGGDVILFRPHGHLIPRYTGYMMDCEPIVHQKATMGRGFTVYHIYGKQLKYLRIPIPPPEEQAAIVRFLAHADEQIQRYIAAKQRLIGLLDEQRQALVHQAVTRGLDPNVLLKPSGMEWLGEVPEHWEAVRLGSIGKFSKGNGGTKEDEVPSGVPCIRYGDIYTSHKYSIRASRAYIKPEKTGEYTPLQYGDILFAGSGETVEEIGKSAVNLIEEPAYSGGDVIIFRPTVRLNAEFTGYAVDSPMAQAQKSAMGRGFTVIHIYGNQLKSLQIALPPIHEQEGIVDHINQGTALIDKNIARSGRQIDLMNEYRTRLIADVVTGKLDVRDAAANLPDPEN